jgi:hypothetical protein
MIPTLRDVEVWHDPACNVASSAFMSSFRYYNKRVLDVNQKKMELVLHGARDPQVILRGNSCAPLPIPLVAVAIQR